MGWKRMFYVRLRFRLGLNTLIDNIVSVAVQLRRAVSAVVGLKVKIPEVSQKTTRKGPEVSKVLGFSHRRLVEVLFHFHVYPAASHRKCNYSGDGSNMLF